MRSNRKLLLMTDYDGTLVPLREKPELAVPDQQLLDLITELTERQEQIIAIISGRDLQQLQQFFPIPGLCLVGGHGGQILWPEGDEESCIDFKAVAAVSARIGEMADKIMSREWGFLLEYKQTGVAVHYRLAPPQLAIEKMRQLLSQVRQWLPADWEILSGKKVLEFKPACTSKGKALLRLLQRWPHFWPVYFGDDVTDESAFQVLYRRGTGILVADLPRPTAAHFRLRDYREVRQLLKTGSSCLFC